MARTPPQRQADKKCTQHKAVVDRTCVVAAVEQILLSTRPPHTGKQHDAEVWLHLWACRTQTWKVKATLFKKKQNKQT